MILQTDPTWGFCPCSPLSPTSAPCAVGAGAWQTHTQVALAAPNEYWSLTQKLVGRNPPKTSTESHWAGICTCILDRTNALSLTVSRPTTRRQTEVQATFGMFRSARKSKQRNTSPARSSSQAAMVAKKWPERQSCALLFVPFRLQCHPSHAGMDKFRVASMRGKPAIWDNTNISNQPQNQTNRFFTCWSDLRARRAFSSVLFA